MVVSCGLDASLSPSMVHAFWDKLSLIRLCKRSPRVRTRAADARHGPGRVVCTMSDLVVLLIITLPLAAVAVLWLCYLTSLLYAARQRSIRAVDAIRADHRRLSALPNRLSADLQGFARIWSADRFLARLRAIPIEDLKRTGITNVRWAALRSAGFHSLGDVQLVTAARLQSLPGVGPTTAGRVVAATAELVQTLRAEPAPLPSADLSEPHAAPLVQRATACIRAQGLDPTPVLQAVEATSSRLQLVRNTTGFLAWLGTLFGASRSEVIAQADALTTDAQAVRATPAFQSVMETVFDIESGVQAPPMLADLVARYAKYHAAYVAVLERALADVRSTSDRQAASTATTMARAEPRAASLVQAASEPVKMQAAAEPVKVPTGAAVSRGYSIPTAPAVRSGPATITITISGAAQRRVADDARWYGPGERARIAGYDVAGGLLYVGRHLASIAPYRGPDPALINPDLPVEKQRVDWNGEQMPYWPSYTDVAPVCRGAYLRWLAEGRKHPTVGIGYVFLFFYGIERRLLHDGSREPLSASEREAILVEVERLLSIYGAQSSFRRYASEFVTLARLQGGSTKLSSAPPPVIEPGTELPLSIRLGLAELVSAGRAIPSEWALAWVRSHPETRWRTPAQRCQPELERLFAIRYRERYGEGMVVKPNRTRLTGAYRPASASFGDAVGVPLGDLPDVTVLSAPVHKLRELTYGCIEDLEPYSRAIGRDPAARERLAAVALLPKELVGAGISAAGDRLLTFVRSCLEKAPSAVVSAGALQQQAGITEPWSRAHALSVAQWLQMAGYGIEPDVRFGSRLPKPTDQVVLFRVPEGTRTPTPAYNGAVALLNMAVLVAQSDGAVDRDEEARLTSRVQEAMHLEDAERARLAAHLQWLLATGANLASSKKRAEHLEPSHRDAVAAFLVGVAAADGRLDPKEVDVLGRLYALLGLDRDRLFADLHSLGVPEPAAKQQRAAEAFTLDRARIEAKLKESAAVSALLQDIFAEDEPAQPAPVAASAGALLVKGFDPVHSALLHELAIRDSWTRDELEGSAARLGVLPDGALDVINERAYDLCGEPAIEGDDPLIVNRQVLKELMA